MTGLAQVVPAAVARLRAAPGVLALPEDVLGTDEDAGLWVFQGSGELKPFRDPKGTGTSAAVVELTGTWAANVHNTMDFPRLTVAVFSDTSRAADGTPIAWDATARAVTVWEALDWVLHDPSNSKQEEWEAHGVRVLSCLRETVSIQAVPNLDGMVRLSCEYQASL